MRYQPSKFTLGHKLARSAWGLVWLLLYRPSPRAMHGWRCWLLRLFGARVGRGAHPYPGARVWAPWNLELGGNSSLADGVDCYSVGRVRIGSGVTVSQYVFLCAATHDYEDAEFPLLTGPITVGDNAWLCADVFVGPGVTIGAGAVVGARSSVFKDVPPWAVVAGSPAKFVKRRHVPGLSPPDATAGPSERGAVGRAPHEVHP